MARKTTITFFFVAFFFYLAFSPAVFRSMGYMEEEVLTAKYLLSKVGLFPAPPNVTELPFPRNGFVTLVVHMPFLVVSNLLFHGSSRLEDAVLAIEPVALTAGILTILFVWIRKLNADWKWSVILPLVVGFSTMLWPYAYIGLETTQALFVMLTAYLAFEGSEKKSWPRAILLGLLGAMAVSAKSTGLVLMPAMLFLLWRFYRTERGRLGFDPSLIPKGIVTLSILFAIFIPNYFARAVFWNAWGGTEYLKFWAIKEPVYYVLNLIAFVGSPNKGLIVFAPIAVFGIFSIPAAWRVNRELTIFVVLVFGCAIGAFSLLIPWTDENWGPRYLHTSVAPLVLCFAAARAAKPFRWRKEVPLTVAAMFGLIISFFGAIYSYGALHISAIETTQSTLQNLQGDLVWNHPAFNMRLFRIWLNEDNGGSTAWEPYHHWYFEVPKDAPPLKSRDLRDVMVPHSVIIRHWGTTGGGEIVLWLAGLASAIVAAILTLSLWRQLARAFPDDAPAMVSS